MAASTTEAPLADSGCLVTPATERKNAVPLPCVQRGCGGKARDGNRRRVPTTSGKTLVNNATDRRLLRGQDAAMSPGHSRVHHP